MAIKLNSTTITSIKLNTTNITSVKLNGVKVWPTETINLIWQFVMSYSSEPDYYDFKTSQYINGDYEQGITHLNTHYPAGDYYEGFVAVIADQSTLDFFEFVVVLV